MDRDEVHALIGSYGEQQLRRTAVVEIFVENGRSDFIKLGVDDYCVLLDALRAGVENAQAVGGNPQVLIELLCRLDI